MGTSAAFYKLSADNRSALLVVTTLVFLLITILSIFAKIWIRCRVGRLLLHDYVLLGGALLFFVETVCILNASHSGLGKYQDEVDDGALDRLHKLQYSSSLLAISATACAKISICLLIKSVNSHGFMSVATRSLLTLIFVTSISGFLALALQCPLPTPWDSPDTDKCPGARPIYIYNGITTVVTDIFICFLAVAMIWRVQTSRKRKLQVVALFAFRIICPITTIPTLQSHDFLYYSTSNASWLAIEPTIWFQTSLSLSIITACFPGMKNVFDSFLGNTIATNIDAPYQLNTIRGKEGFHATAYANETRGTMPCGTPNRGPKSTASAPDQGHCATGHATGQLGWRAREDKGKTDGQSDSIRNLTEDTMAINEEEVQFDISPRSVSLESSGISICGE